MTASGTLNRGVVPVQSGVSKLCHTSKMGLFVFSVVKRGLTGGNKESPVDSGDLIDHCSIDGSRHTPK